MMTKEKIEKHIKHLQEKHRDLEKEIAELNKHYEEDLHINTIKKKKLKLKDEIEHFKKQLVTL